MTSQVIYSVKNPGEELLNYLILLHSERFISLLEHLKLSLLHSVITFIDFLQFVSYLLGRFVVHNFNILSIYQC
uniref:Uncharacterized protein n=1 Tax=Rhizophora mucronata TaxID=61149 RepID=A0A2P2QP16_RHIMU